MLRTLVRSAGLEADGLGPEEMHRLIDVFVQERRAKGQRVVIEVDDADRFGPAAWSEIARMRADGTADPAAPDLLLGLVHIDESSSPAADFIRSLEAPDLVVLSWMSANGVCWYLDWRLRRFGLEGLVTPAATRLIARCTRGCFAAVDHVCQMALLLLRNRSGNQIDVGLVREAIRTLKRQRELRHPAAAPRPKAELIVSRDGTVLRRATVRGRFLIGRSHFNDLSLDSSYLSRHHLAIVRGETGYYLSDLNSVNGVSLNGQRVQSAPVGDGDVIAVGPYRIKVSLGETIGGHRVAGRETAELAETAVMPAPAKPEPTHLKVIK